VLLLLPEHGDKPGPTGPWTVWRVGHSAGPKLPPPPKRRAWKGRFDDPDRKFGTLYAAPDLRTALAERLAPLRPGAQSVREMEDLFGPSGTRGLHVVRLSEFEQDVVATATVTTELPVVDLTDIAIRTRLATSNRALLAAHGLNHLDFADLHDRHRPFTQALARSIHLKDYAGVRYASNITGDACLALFEGRHAIIDLDHGPLDRHLDEVRSVAASLGLTVRR